MGGGAAIMLCVCALAVALAPLVVLVTSRITGSLTRTVAQVACSSTSTRDIAPVDATGQFTVQPVYAEVMRYATAAEGQPASQRAQIWNRDVLNPYPPMNDIFTEAVGGTDASARELGSIDPGTFRCITQDMEAAHVTEQALSALKRAAQDLRGPHTLVYLLPWISHTFGGASQERSMLIPMWEADPLNRTLPRDPERDWSFMYFPLYHEYLEVVRYDRLGSASNAYLTLLDNVVTDGMADNYAARMSGYGLQDFGISAGEEARVWAQVKPTLNQYANPNQEAVMTGDPTRGIPRAAGYQIGDHIVAGYLARHPGVTFNQLAGMDAQAIYAGSGYDG